MSQTDILMLDRIGGDYTSASLATKGLGGSEIELLQVAQGLTAKGYRVVVANGVETPSEVAGIRYVSHSHAWQHPPAKALYLQRFSTPETRLEIPSSVRVVVRANDVYCEPYEVHRALLTSGRASLVTNTRWQAQGFPFAKDPLVLPPMLEPTPTVKKQRGLFVFASGAMKGFEATVALWCQFKARHPSLRKAQLAVVCPGWGNPRALTAAEHGAGIRYYGNPTPEVYRQWIAKAEGLFTVLTMAETFGCFAALAERAGTRTHILCRAGVGGLPEALTDHRYLTEDPEAFESDFVIALHTPLTPTVSTPDLSPATLIDRWEDTLHLTSQPILVTSPEQGFAPDPTLVANQPSLGPLFGDFLSLLRASIAPGGSEFGVGLTLFSLAASIQARSIVEIGRFKGFSTLALAAACQLQRLGWTEPAAAEQRPDVDYTALRARPPARLLSIDPFPLPEAQVLLAKAGLLDLVDFVDLRSSEAPLPSSIDLLFIDGGHTLADVRADLARWVPQVRAGGYFLLHDYFGWFQNGQNGSPIAAVIATDLPGCDRLLLDTQYSSLVLFRKAQSLTESWDLPAQPSPAPPRADGRPTVGLCLIAKGDEVSTVATRAITSAKRAGVDCLTVVCDADDASAEVARALGADVYIRPSPKIDWERGLGIIAGARNDALALAERRTDYVLILDADDHFDGVLPPTFDHDAYEVTILDGGLEYQRVQLFRSSLGWRYTGIIHETLTIAGCGPVGRLSTLRYLRGRSTYAFQDQDPPQVKYSKHAQLATRWLSDHPDDTRMQFYLARSYHDAGRLDEAVVAYAHRITMLHGWEEERSYSAYQIGKIHEQQGKDPTLAYLQSHAIGLPKAEPLVALARWYRDDTRRQFSTAYALATRAAAIPQPTASIFLEPAVYQYAAAAEVAICAYWLGQIPEALARFQALLPNVPPEQRGWAESQIAICQRDLRKP